MNKYPIVSGKRLIKALVGLYFNKDEWKKFYQFLENCYKEIQEQELAFKKIIQRKE